VIPRACATDLFGDWTRILCENDQSDFAGMFGEIEKEKREREIQVEILYIITVFKKGKRQTSPCV
jgi:hypothetical protein